MFKACARSRLASHVALAKPRSIAAGQPALQHIIVPLSIERFSGLIPRLRSIPQAPCQPQKRTYATEHAEPHPSTTDPHTTIAAEANARLARHLSTVFSPLEFPPELAARILTHSSFRDWRLAHNARFSFIGASQHPQGHTCPV